MKGFAGIEGVRVTELRQIADERGAVLHMLRCDAPDFSRFGECYFSELLPGVVKAWKKHTKQSQNLTVPTGRIRCVIFDDRELSSTRGNFQAIDVGRPDVYVRIHIPPELWYGFACIGNAPALIVNCTDFPHDPADNEQLPANTPEIPYHWAMA